MTFGNPIELRLHPERQRRLRQKAAARGEQGGAPGLQRPGSVVGGDKLCLVHGELQPVPRGSGRGPQGLRGYDKPLFYLALRDYNQDYRLK